MRILRRPPENINYTRLLLYLWIGISAFAGLKQYLKGSYNNYLIFKYVFINTLNEAHLYTPQPEFYFDNNHYGPFFSLIIAPFALLPDVAGVVLWAVFTSLVLFLAIYRLPLTQLQKNLILLICTHELFTSLVNLQSNPLIAGLIILTFLFAIKNKEIWSGVLIAIGFLIKLYGIVGFAFILFAKNKFRMILAFIAATVILALLPSIISSVDFQLQSYQDWYNRLLVKNQLNTGPAIMQNISAIGLINRTISRAIETKWILGSGMLLMGAMVLVNFKRFNNTRFQYLLLSAVLLFTVLFSTGSESPTYIIAFAGVAIWYVTKTERTLADHILLGFAIILTSFSPSDLFPHDAKMFVRNYSLKALPCFIIWLEIIRESLFLKPEPKAYE
jgi:hypothetical protein